MSEHSIFYYPYASFTDQQALLLKAAALYFDKLHILDPFKASSGTIGPGMIGKDVGLLEDAGILDRVGPAQVLLKYEDAIADAIRADLNDPKFNKLCETSGRAQYWTLALAKIPKEIRNDPEFQPLDRSMQHLMGTMVREVVPDAAKYAEDFAEIFDEYRESDSGVMEYRYADYPLELGESIMVNHALFGSLLYTGSIPLTDDSFHNKVLNFKIERSMAIPEIKDILEDKAIKRKFKRNKLSMESLTDIDLAVISPMMPLEEILKYREDNKDSLQEVRNKLGWLAREIENTPWTNGFENELDSKAIPKIHHILDEAKKSRDSWLKSDRGKKSLKLAGITTGAAVATISLALSPTPLLPVAIVTGVLGLISSSVIPGLEWMMDWRDGKNPVTENGLHYLLKISGA